MSLITASDTVKTNTLDTLTTSSNLLIGNATNTGSITIATVNTGNTNANPAISIGTDAGTKTIKINNNTNSVHCSSIDLQGSSINHITPTTGTLSIGDLQTSGTLNLGTNSSRTGNINLGSASNVSTSINSTTGFITLGANQTSGTIYIGAGAGIARSGPISIATATSSTCAVNILNAGGGGTAGSVNIANGTGVSQTTTVNISSGTASGTVTIGNSAGQLIINSQPVSISTQSAPTASTTKNVYINGTDTTSSKQYDTRISNFKMLTIAGAIELNHSNQASTDAVSLVTRQDTGALNIGGGSGVTRTGAINLGSQTGNTCAVNIMSATGATTIGSVNIANGTLQATPVNIQTTTGTGLVTIGNSANTTTLASGTLNVTGNLTIGTGKNITLQPTASYVAPTALTMLGGVSSGTAISANTWTNNSRVQLSNIPITQAGVYLITANIFLTFGASTAVTSLDIRVASDNTGTSPNTVCAVYETVARTYGVGEINYQLSGVYSTTVATNTLYFTGICGFTGGSLANPAGSSYPEFFKAVRIA